MNREDDPYAAIESLRRERDMGFDPTAQGLPDYASAGLKIQVAMHHLDESIPNGQLERTRAGLRLLNEGTAELTAWLVGRGV